MVSIVFGGWAAADVTACKNGKIDDFRIYRGALDQAAVTALYTA
ncbi:hypothetical protein LJR289_001528 [Pseudoduganella sp. LjRoot289]